jgi:hypothetical protein
MVSLDKTLVVKESITVIGGGVLTVKADGITFLSGSDCKIKENPQGCEDELRETLDCRNLSFVQPHLMLNVMAWLVTTTGGR